MKVSISALLCVICFAVSLAMGRPIAIVNFSFENPDVADGTSGSLAPGWTNTGPGGLVRDPSSAQYANATGNLTPLPGSADGFQHLSFHVLGAPQVNTTGISHQETSEIITANTIYLLTVAIGSPLDGNPGIPSIQLTGNGNSLATVFLSTPSGTFTNHSLTFEVLPGNPYIGQVLGIDLQMTALPQPAVPFNIDFDNVRLEATAIPEPTIMAALMLCCGLILMRRPGQHA